MPRRGFNDNTEFSSAALADIMARAKALEMAQQASEAKSGGALIVQGQPVFEEPDPMIKVIDKNTGETIFINASTLDNMTRIEDSPAKTYRVTPGEGFSAPREAVVQHAIDRGILPGDEIIAEQLPDQVKGKPTLIETLRTIQPGSVEPRGISGGGVSRTVPTIENPISEESILENVLRGNNPGPNDTAIRTGTTAAPYNNESIKTGRTPSVMEGESGNLWEWLLKMTTPAVGNVVEEAPPTILENVVSANAEDIPVTQDTILARLNEAINEGDKIDAIRQRPGALFVNEMNRRAKRKASNRATGNLNEFYLRGLKNIRDRGLEDARDWLFQHEYGLDMNELRREPPTINAAPRNPAAIYDIESLLPRLTPQQEGEQRILDILREQAIQNIQEDAVNAGGVPPMPPGSGIDPWETIPYQKEEVAPFWRDTGNPIQDNFWVEDKSPRTILETVVSPSTVEGQYLQQKENELNYQHQKNMDRLNEAQARARNIVGRPREEGVQGALDRLAETMQMQTPVVAENESPRIIDLLQDKVVSELIEDGQIPVGVSDAGGAPPMPPGSATAMAGPVPGNWAGRMLGDNRVRLGLAGLGAAGLTALIVNAVAQDQERKRQSAANSLNYPMEY